MLDGPSRATARGSVEEFRVAYSVQKLIVSSSRALVDDQWVRGRKRWPSSCRGARPWPIEGGRGVGGVKSTIQALPTDPSSGQTNMLSFSSNVLRTLPLRNMEEAACQPHRIVQRSRAGHHEYKMKLASMTVDGSAILRRVQGLPLNLMDRGPCQWARCGRDRHARSTCHL